MTRKLAGSRPVGRPALGDAENRRRGRWVPDQPAVKPKTARRRKAAPKASSRDYGAIAAGYATDVLGDRIPACGWVRLACERQERDRLRADVDPAWPYTWSEAHAVEACHFLEQLPHVEGQWAT